MLKFFRNDHALLPRDDAICSTAGVVSFTVSGIKVRNWGCFPLTHHGGDFDHQIRAVQSLAK